MLLICHRRSSIAELGAAKRIACLPLSKQRSTILYRSCWSARAHRKLDSDQYYAVDRPVGHVIASEVWAPKSPEGISALIAMLELDIVDRRATAQGLAAPKERRDSQS
jgi:hypothetical protein